MGAGQGVPLESTKFGYILTRIRQQTPQQAKEALIRSGIITPSGDLTEHYRLKPPPARKLKAAARKKPAIHQRPPTIKGPGKVES